jgi:hypothetical protein
MRRIRIERAKVRRERSWLEPLPLDPRDPTSFEPRALTDASILGSIDGFAGVEGGAP